MFICVRDAYPPRCRYAIDVEARLHEHTFENLEKADLRFQTNTHTVHGRWGSGLLLRLAPSQRMLLNSRSSTCAEHL
jgi:hypothetical protein